MSNHKWVGGSSPRRRRSEFVTKRERQQAVATSWIGGSLTVEEYLWEWLDNHSLGIKPRTRAGYEHLVRVCVAPRIGRKRLQVLRPADLGGLYRELLNPGGRGGKPLSARTVEYVQAVLRKALNDAVRNDKC